MAKHSGRIFDDKNSGLFQRSKGGSWFIRLKDARGKDTTKNLGKVKSRALELAKLERAQLVRQRLGHVDERAEKLKAELKRPIEEHLAAHRDYLSSKGNVPAHIDSTIGKATEAAACCGWRTLQDVTAESLDGFRRDLLDRGTSHVTVNRHTRACKQLTRWLTRSGKLAADPLLGVVMLNEQTDRRRVRGVFSDDELGRLFAVAQSKSVTTPARFNSEGRQTDNGRTFNIPGRDVLYRLAASTGLRLGEIRSLKVSDFRLDEQSPVVLLPAKASKRGTLDVQPLPADLVCELRTVFATMHPSTQPWCKLPSGMAQIIAADCSAAGIEALTPGGEIRDFHSLRGTYITRLAKANVPFATVQRLARHSTPTLTAKHYVSLGLVDTAAAVDLLPAIATSEGPAIDAG